MRGAQFDGGDGVSRRGLIPAHAGSTLALRAQPGAARAHPRACGEHSSLEGIAVLSLGSSPRMRGARAGYGRLQVVNGLIPAHAGSTRGDMVHDRLDGAHPRACGEHDAVIPKIWVEVGSSPRMRGALADGHGEALGARLIPAHAGSTLRPQAFSLQVWAHPRACGEH